ncbi:MAG: hypothetical protein WBW69_15185, partial [Candidatus Korobacteraceae bacterium]
ETYFDHWPKKVKDGIRTDFYNKLNNAQMEYGRCKEVLLDPKDDTRIFEKLKSGAKSKSAVGQLTDNLSEIIEGEINMNALFTMRIWGLVIESSETEKEIQDLVSEVSKEIG